MSLLRSAFLSIRFFGVFLLGGSDLSPGPKDTTLGHFGVKAFGLLSRFRFLRHAISIVVGSILIYIVGAVLASNANGVCVGWKCDVVYCPNGYAVQVPGKGLLPCENFDEYIETKNQGLLR